MICPKVYCSTFPIYSTRSDAKFAIAGAFYMVGDIDSARQKGEKILADLEKN